MSTRLFKDFIKSPYPLISFSCIWPFVVLHEVPQPDWHIALTHNSKIEPLTHPPSILAGENNGSSSIYSLFIHPFLNELLPFFCKSRILSIITRCKSMLF